MEKSQHTVPKSRLWQSHYKKKNRVRYVELRAYECFDSQLPSKFSVWLILISSEENLFLQVHIENAALRIR